MKISSVSSYSGINFIVVVVVVVVVIIIIIIINSLPTNCTNLRSGYMLCVTCTSKRHPHCHFDIQILETLILFPH